MASAGLGELGVLPTMSAVIDAGSAAGRRRSRRRRLALTLAPALGLSLVLGVSGCQLPCPARFGPGSAELEAARRRLEAACDRASAAEIAAPAAPRPPEVPAARGVGLDHLVRSGTDLGAASLAYPPPRPPAVSPEDRAARAELKAAAEAYARLRRQTERRAPGTRPSTARRR